MIIPTSVPYNSFQLEENIYQLLAMYPFLKQTVIGNSILGRPIYSLVLGNGPRKVLYVGSTHANEFITSTLLMKFLEDLCIAYQKNDIIIHQHIRDLFNSVALHIVPMLNPDGVDLVTRFFFIFLFPLFTCQNDCESLSSDSFS